MSHTIIARQEDGGRYTVYVVGPGQPLLKEMWEAKQLARELQKEYKLKRKIPVKPVDSLV